jgi:2-oxoglutarate dehydrogenase E2 component (dihydrolipoamide succinyltransferase)
MLIQIIVPPLGESVTEATISKWHKKKGDFVSMDELLVELETDKVTLEVNAPSAGIISEILFAEGSNVSVGDVLGSVDSSQANASISPSEVKKDKEQATANSESKPASISAQKIAAEAGADLANISGSGKDGRITKGDVLQNISKPQQPSTSLPSMPAAPIARATDLREERVKMTRLRQTIAARLKESQNTAAILTTFNEVDMSEVFRIRKQYQERFKDKHGIKLGFMSFFVKAAVIALQEIPTINAEIDGEHIVYKNHYDIGVAVGTEQGLVVPVLRDADKLSFAAIEQTIASLGKKARDGKLSMQDMVGGTFSITNGGIYGSLLSTPIINPPQSGILGMHNVVERPVVVNGQIVAKPMMYIALSYDHRIVDGKEAVTFLVKIKELVENPEKLLFDL